LAQETGIGHMISASVKLYGYAKKVKNSVLEYVAQRKRLKKAKVAAEIRRLKLEAGLLEEGEEEEEREDDPVVNLSDEESEREEDEPDDPWARLSDGTDYYPRDADEEVAMEIDPWSEELTQEDFEELTECVKTFHPLFTPASELIPEEEIIKAVKARRNPLLKFNATLSFGEGASQARGMGVEGAGKWANPPGKMRPRQVPNNVLVTGHTKKSAGNMGINGIYERHKEDYHGRPVYQKVMERRHVPEWLIDDDGSIMVNPQDNLRRDYRPRTPRSQVLAKRYQQSAKLDLDPEWDKDPVYPKLLPSKEVWFIFFDDHRGAWCVGPAVGAPDIYARCYSLEAAVPHNLKDWDVWDVGLKKWYESKGMQVIKAG